MPPRRSVSPARTKTPTERVTRSASKKTPPAARAPSPPSRAKKSAKKKASSGDVSRSLRIYFGCVGTLFLLVSVLFSVRPASPPGGVCDGVGPTLLLNPSTASVKALWACTKAYQEANWWFVLVSLEVLYIGIKMLAIPAAFTLCLLAGALFPLPLAQLVTGFGEAIGSSLCYLLSQAFLSPIIEHFFASKLEIMRKRAHEERQYMLSFNFFLRLTPFMPNWMINLSCPLVGVPLGPFFIGSLFGTQLSLLFLALSGATLKVAGESGFDLEKVLAQMKILGLLMLVLQCVPIAFIYFQKRRAGTA